MNPDYRPYIKICCIKSRCEAALAVSAGASAIGLVSAMPSGPGVIDEDLIAEIARSVPPPVATFLLTSKLSAEEIIDQHRRCRTSVIQIVDDIGKKEVKKLRRRLPGIKLIQVIHVSGKRSIDEAKSFKGKVDALLLDSGNRHPPVKELGGTGRIHDWQISRRISEEAGLPVFLAGGLNAFNVREAVNIVRPFAIDLCSGVRSQGKLDQKKLSSFFQALDGLITKPLSAQSAFDK